MRVPRDLPFVVQLDRLADERPGDVAVVGAGGCRTWEQLRHGSLAAARTLNGMGVDAGSFAAVALDSDVAFVEAVLGAWRLGATPLLVPTGATEREVEALLAVSGAAACIRPPDVSWTGEAVPDLWGARVSRCWKAPVSGGTTGAPKVIVSTDPAVMGTLRPFTVLGRLPAEGASLFTAPLWHNAPFLFAMTSLLLGKPIVLMRRFDARAALELAEEHRVTWMYAVPTMMRRVLALPPPVRTNVDLSALQVVLHTGAPCPPAVKLGWLRWLGPERVWEVYAATEGTAATLIGGLDWLEHPGSVGQALFGDVAVRHGNRPAAPGEVGEIVMRPTSGRTTYRYLGGTPERRDGWEVVGDIGTVDEAGWVRLLGRTGDEILTGGIKVYPTEVEAALEEHPDVAGACVVGVPDEDLGERVHAVVESSRDIPDSELRRHLSGLLATHKIPRTFSRAEQPLRDEAGKARSAELKRRVAQRASDPGRARRR